MIVDFAPKLTCDAGVPGCRSELKLIVVGEGVQADEARQVAVTALLALAQVLDWGFTFDGGTTRHRCPRCL